MRYFIIDEDGDVRWTDEKEIATQLSDIFSVYYYDELLKMLVRYGNVDDQYRMPREWGKRE